MKSLIAALAVALAGAAAAGVVAHASAKTRVVKVSEREYHITLSTTKLAPGKVEFVIKNTGKLAHALKISGPGISGKRIPLIHPGKTATLTVTLRSGTYFIWCPVPGHAALGMKTSLKAVSSSGSGSGAGSGAGSGTTTPTTTGGGGEAWG